MHGCDQELVPPGPFVTHLRALQAPPTPTHDPVATSVVTRLGHSKSSLAANFFIFTMIEVIRPKSRLITST